MARPRRILRISFNPLVLTFSVALGVWLGFIAIGLTTYLGYQLYTDGNQPPVAEVLTRHLPRHKRNRSRRPCQARATSACRSTRRTTTPPSARTTSARNGWRNSAG